MERTVIPGTPAIILVSFDECDRWHEDEALRSEVEVLARRLRVERGGDVAVSTVAGYVVDIWEHPGHWQSA